MKIKELLSAIGLAPKTLDQAKASLASAQPALDSVAALFASAGLDLDAMLAAGPDSLKAHLEGLTAKDAELAVAIGEVATLKGQLSASATETTSAKDALAAISTTHADLCASIGFKADGDKAAFQDAFKAHVAKESALLLAKDGRPPVAHVSKDAQAQTTMTRAAFDALPPKEQSAFSIRGGRITDALAK